MYGGRNVDNSSFRTMVGWGGGFFRAVSAEWGGRSLPVFRLSSLVLNKTPPPGEIDNTPLGERHTRSSKRGEAAIARLRTDGRKSAQCRRGLRCALVLNGNENGQCTRKNAQFRNGFWRCLRRALVASGCENERTTRKSGYFVRPCALAKIQKVSFKKRAKNAKNGGVKIAFRVCLWAKMSTVPVFGTMGGLGGKF